MFFVKKTPNIFFFYFFFFGEVSKPILPFRFFGGVHDKHKSITQHDDSDDDT